MEKRYTVVTSKKVFTDNYVYAKSKKDAKKIVEGYIKNYYPNKNPYEDLVETDAYSEYEDEKIIKVCQE